MSYLNEPAEQGARAEALSRFEAVRGYRGDVSRRSTSGWAHPFAHVSGVAGETGPIVAATPGQRWSALASLAVLAVVTVLLLPVAPLVGPSLPGFVPSYQTAVLLIYAMSYLHIIKHFRRTRLIPLLYIASGCLFSAAILLIQMFSFRIWGPEQLVGSTPATTTWLWTFWHVGPAVVTVAYVVASRPGAPVVATARQSTGWMAVIATVAVLAAVAAATTISTWGVPFLPQVVVGDDYRGLVASGVGPGVEALTLAALGLLVWRTRCASTMELCLATALAMLALDDVLTLAGGSRLSLGWYVGRAEAALSAAVMLGFYVSDIDRRFVAVSSRAAALTHDRAALERAVSDQRAANQVLVSQTLQDGLTGLANRRHFDEKLEAEWLRARREGQPLTLLMVDVDHFKSFNDLYGHPGGDECLRAIAGVLQEIARRPADLPARYGGEEFAILLPNTDPAGGMHAAQALISALAWRAVRHEGARAQRVTVSVGVACCLPGRDGGRHSDLVAHADRALYAAKAAGRDCAVADADRCTSGAAGPAAAGEQLPSDRPLRKWAEVA